MGLEARVERLESHFDALDSAVRSLITITGETHQIVLENQRENRLKFQQIDNRFEQIDNRFEQIEQRLSQQDHVIAANQQETRERFDQLELLIRQSFPKN